MSRWWMREMRSAPVIWEYPPWMSEQDAAVRALAPQVIITDELGTAEDLRAVNTALDSGVTVIASVHAGSIEELRRKEYSRLLRFNRYVSLQRGERGPVYRAFDADFMPLGARRDRYCCI